ncbi:MAG: glycosyltransferase [Actinomycetota bacterium]
MASTLVESETARPAITDDQEIPSVLAIVVTHNGRQWLTDSLVGLNTQTYPTLDVLVVDDASTREPDRPLKRVAKRHLKRRRWAYLRTPRPLGFGGAINWALSRVRTDADLLLFIHDDAALTPESLEWMVARILTEDSIAIVGPKVVAWDDPARLEEVGMSADRFGYPYKGLDEDEIDLGQHDASVEVFYVTSTCMLMRHDVFRSMRGWDSTMKAFSEDLDLCWRARVAGHSVRVEPKAKARHAIALATGQRTSRFKPIRYYIRRNRLRTVTKNVSGPRLVALLPQFVLLAFIEMLGFVVLREPGEIVNLGRALLWNFITFPQTLSERARVQRKRRVSDGRLRRLTVRQSTRVRSYGAHLIENVGDRWGRRAEVLAQRSAQARVIGRRLRGWAGAGAAVAIVLLLLGFRHFLWAPPSSVGELLPYPDRVTGLVRAFFSPWQSVGLGQPGPAPPAFLMLGAFPLAALGNVALAQKLLVLALGVIGFIGAYKLVSDVVDRVGRVAAGVAYVLGPIGYSGLRGGDLGALVLGATAPFVILSMLRLTGWVRPPGWVRGQSVARVSLAAAISAAFVPGSLILYAVVAIVLTAVGAVMHKGRRVVPSLASCLIGLLIGWVLLLPWSATWGRPGSSFSVLISDPSWKTFAHSFQNHGMLSVVLGQTPKAPALFGLGLTLLGLVALVVGEGQRRRVAFALWSLVVASGLFVALFASGLLRPLVATPTEAGAIPAVAFAALAGLAVASLRLDLPRRGLGLTHALTITGLSVGLLLAVGALLPSLWHGEWAPGQGSSSDSARVTAQIDSVLGAAGQQSGQFRALWVGEKWLPNEATSSRFVPKGYFLTGPKGQELTDLFGRNEDVGDGAFDRVVSSIETGTTDRGGSLLAAFNVGYVVVQSGPEARPWLAQRDLTLTRSAATFNLFSIDSPVARAGVYSALPSWVTAIDQNKPDITSDTTSIEREIAGQLNASSYREKSVAGPGFVFLAEQRSGGWAASIGDERLDRVDGGWGNAFAIPKGVRGDLTLRYARRTTSLLLLLAITLAWIVVVGAAFSRRARAPQKVIE